jgi:hypothetical protein
VGKRAFFIIIFLTVDMRDQHRNIKTQQLSESTPVR